MTQQQKRQNRRRNFCFIRAGVAACFVLVAASMALSLLNAPALSGREKITSIAADFSQSGIIVPTGSDK